MTRSEHFVKAEKLGELAESQGSHHPNAMYTLARAQLHAMLANCDHGVVDHAAHMRKMEDATE